MLPCLQRLIAKEILIQYCMCVFPKITVPLHELDTTYTHGIVRYYSQHNYSEIPQLPPKILGKYGQPRGGSPLRDLKVFLTI